MIIGDGRVWGKGEVSSVGFEVGRKFEGFQSLGNFGDFFNGEFNRDFSLRNVFCDQ